MIDFNKSLVSLKEFILDGIREFESNNPSVKWSSVAFEVVPYYGSVFLSFEVPENCRRFVAENSDYAAEDELGKFNSSPGDFAFPFINEMILSEWEQEYFNEEKYEVKWITGEKLAIIEESAEADINETHNHLVFELFKYLINSTRIDIVGVSKNHTQNARIGVHSDECDFEYFVVLDR